MSGRSSPQLRSRSNIGSDRSGLPFGNAASDQSARLWVIDAEMAKKYLGAIMALTLTIVFWMIVLDFRSDSLNVNLIERASVLAEQSSATKVCLVRRQKLEVLVTKLKSDLRTLRRKKNYDALAEVRHQHECEATLEQVQGPDTLKLQFQTRALTAKIEDDKDAALRYWLCEALAKVQETEPMAVWEQYPKTEDVKNTLVVELAQILQVEVAEIQGKIVGELIQLVNDL